MKKSSRTAMPLLHYLNLLHLAVKKTVFGAVSGTHSLRKRANVVSHNRMQALSIVP